MITTTDRDEELVTQKYPTTPVDELSIHIDFPNSDHKLFHSRVSINYTDAFGVHGYGPPADSLGKKFEILIKDSGYKLPPKVNVSLCISKPAFDKLNLEKYLHRFAALNEWKLENWNMGNNKFDLRDPYIGEFRKTGPFGSHYINYVNIDPCSLAAAIVVAVKDNPSALGRSTPLLDTNSLEKIPQVAKYISQYQASQKQR